MMKPLPSIALGLLLSITVSVVASAADPAGAAATPLLKVTYGEVWGPSPLMYSYSVWPSGEIRYEPSSLDYNGVKTRIAKTIRTTQEKALGAVNELLKAGFLSLQPEVRRVSAAAQDGAIDLEHIIFTHSQRVTLEFHFESDNFKIEIDELDILPWAGPVLRRVEEDLGIARLVD